MNREDIIAEISVAVRSVLTAQMKLHPEWKERIRQTKPTQTPRRRLPMPTSAPSPRK